MSTPSFSLAALSLRNILFATDLSPASETAFRYARAIARRHAAQLHVVHVAGNYAYQLLEPEPLNITFRLPEVEAHPTEALQHLFSGLPAQAPLRRGEIWEVINEIIRRREIDLLVVGTHGRHGVDRLLHGSIAEDVFRNATCPVLTVGQDVKLNGDQTFKINRVLLATDFDPHTDAPRFAAELCNEYHAKLTVLHVSDTDPDVNEEPVPDVNGEFRKVVNETDLWSKPDYILEVGQPAARILQIAERLSPELIVLGARHPDPAKINSHLPWPTVSKVVASAECPVLTVGQEGSAHWAN